MPRCHFFQMVETSNWGLRQGWTGRGWKSAWRGKKAGKSTDPNIWQKVCKLLLRYLFCIMMFWWRKTLNPLTWIWQLLQLVLSSSPTFHLGGEEEGGQLHFPRLIISFLLSPPARHSLSLHQEPGNILLVLGQELHLHYLWTTWSHDCHFTILPSRWGWILTSDVWRWDERRTITLTRWHECRWVKD